VCVCVCARACARAQASVYEGGGGGKFLIDLEFSLPIQVHRSSRAHTDKLTQCALDTNLHHSIYCRASAWMAALQITQER
jgi:hypothetical protein